MQIRAPVTEKEWNDYYRFRWQLLRAPWQQPLGSEKDELETNSYHLMAVNDQNEIIGVARLHQEDEKTAQIRYMAVAESYHRQGIGSQLLQQLEQLAQEQNIKLITLNARENAIAFYQSLGYKITAPAHTLYGAIKHVKMQKQLLITV